MCVHIIGDAITNDNTKQSDFPYTCIITTSILSILFFILCILSCLFCHFYNQLRQKRMIANSFTVTYTVIDVFNISLILIVVTVVYRYYFAVIILLLP